MIETREQQTAIRKNILEKWEKDHPALIEKAIDETVIYRDGSNFRQEVEKLKNQPVFYTLPIIHNWTLEQTLNLLNKTKSSENIAILISCNYKNAGDKILQNKTSVETELCLNTYLYPVLTAHNKDFYYINQRKTYKGLYSNAAMVIPYLDPASRNTYSFIFCAMPQPPKSRISHLDVCSIAEKRFAFIKDICDINNFSTLIMQDIVPTHTGPRQVVYQDIGDFLGIPLQKATNLKNIIVTSSDIKDWTIDAVQRRYNKHISNNIINIYDMKYSILNRKADDYSCLEINKLLTEYNKIQQDRHKLLTKYGKREVIKI